MRRIRTRSSTVGLLMLSLTMAVVSLGLGHAAWPKTLTVNATVQTASISARWLTNTEVPLSNAIICNDIADPYSTAEVLANRDGSDSTLMHVIILNGYPGYIADCSLKWQNDGDVPVTTVEHRINGEDSYNGVSLNLDAGDPNDTGDDVLIQFSNGASPTAPGGGGTDHLTIKVLDTATSGTTLQFTGTHTLKLANP